MGINQISVFVQNDAGRLARVTGILAQAGINLRAISISDTADFGILRIVVDKPDKAVRAMGEAGWTTHAAEVIAVEIEDKPGALHRVLTIFEEAGINIEYLYAALESRNDKAVAILKTKDIETARRWLASSNEVQLLEEC
jgi:hypothetical protein